MLLNLAANAIKFTERGDVILSVEYNSARDRPARACEDARIGFCFVVRAGYKVSGAT